MLHLCRSRASLLRPKSSVLRLKSAVLRPASPAKSTVRLKTVPPQRLKVWHTSVPWWYRSVAQVSTRRSRGNRRKIGKWPGNSGARPARSVVWHRHPLRFSEFRRSVASVHRYCRQGAVFPGPAAGWPAAAALEGRGRRRDRRRQSGRRRRDRVGRVAPAEVLHQADADRAGRAGTHHQQRHPHRGLGAGQPSAVRPRADVDQIGGGKRQHLERASAAPPGRHGGRRPADHQRRPREPGKPGARRAAERTRGRRDAARAGGFCLSMYWV